MIDKDCFSLVLDALENAAAALEESRDYPITLDLVLEAIVRSAAVNMKRSEK